MSPATDKLIWPLLAGVQVKQANVSYRSVFQLQLWCLLAAE